MMFLNMLCVCSKLSKPMLVPFLSSRMVKLMMTHGFCADGIVGLATAAHSVVSTIILYVLCRSLGSVSAF